MPQHLEEVHETKRTLDGRRQQFSCGAVVLSPRLAIVRFEHSTVRVAGGYTIPAGSVTFGFFWSGRHYNLYRFTAPDATVIGYRFDVVDAVLIRGQRVDYTDLLLDAWRSPDGRLTFEDADEVEAAIGAGVLSPRRQAIIARTSRLLARRHERIIADAELDLARALQPEQVV